MKYLLYVILLDQTIHLADLLHTSMKQVLRTGCQKDQMGWNGEGFHVQCRTYF